MSKSPHRASDGATGAEDHSQQKRSTRPSAQLQSEKNPAVALRQTTDEAACRFLQLILPEEGPYIAWIKESNEQKYNVFMSTISQLWVVIKRANDAGDAVYHACANFHEARHDPVRTPPAQRQYGRTKRNVRGAKALWLDIDAGPDKSYANAEKAWQAVLDFCRKANLPSPLIVWSGNGLHVYWPLQLPLDRGTWERQAHGLKALCIKHGLHVDHNRTTDISSVLRTPGTHHRKGQAKEVLCGSIVGPFPISAFPIVVEDPSSRTKAQISKQSTLPNPFRLPLPDYLKALPYRSGLVETVIRSIDSGRDFGPAFGAVAADHCGQLAEFRDKQGQIPEPVWYAGLGVLAHCADGDQLGHDWSRGDPRYTERETQERLDRARQFGPTTCKRFRDLSPAGCRRCPWSRRINSPIALGGPLIAQGRRR
jgi:putative DNA primase/helicase